MAISPLVSVRFFVASALLAILLVPRAGPAEVHLGVLTCKPVPASRVTLLVRSTADIRCALEYSGGQVERYKGETGIILGLDLNFNGQEKFAFTVISSTRVEPGKHALTGKYFGSKASTIAAGGFDGAGLVGGSEDSIGLNPVALEARYGVGIAAGIGFLYIEPEQ